MNLIKEYFLDFVLEFFKTDKQRFKEITPEFLEINRAKYSGEDYLKWLKNKYGELQAAIIVEKERFGKVPLEWEEKNKLVEEAIKKEKDNLK